MDVKKRKISEDRSNDTYLIVVTRDVEAVDFSAASTASASASIL